MATVLAPQRAEVRCPVVACDDRLAVDQERHCLDAEGSGNDGREAVGPIVAVAGEAADAGAIPAQQAAIINAGNVQIWGTGPISAKFSPGMVANTGGQPHQNMQPYLALNFCVALSGIFPSRN